MILDFDITTVASPARGRERLGAVGLDDPRLTNARPPLPHTHPDVPHGLLSSLHNDTVPGVPERGDLMVADSSGLWSKLRIGPRNTVLINPSNNDPSWGLVSLTTMVTGLLNLATMVTGVLAPINGGTGCPFTAGAVVYTDGTGYLTAGANLTWGNTVSVLGINGAWNTSDIAAINFQDVTSTALNSQMNLFFTRYVPGPDNTLAVAKIKMIQSNAGFGTEVYDLAFLSYNTALSTAEAMRVTQGRVWIGAPVSGTLPGGVLQVSSITAAAVGQLIQGFAAQSGNLFETRNSGAALLSFIDASGSLGVRRSTAATAYLHFGAGTATASTAPLKFSTGTSLTAAEAGAMEFTTDDLFFTITTGAARKRLLMADAVGGLVSTRVPFATTNGRLTDLASFTFASSTLTLGTVSATTGLIAFGNSASANLTKFQAGNATAAVTYTLPTADGALGQVMTTSGTGTLSWAAVVGGTLHDVLSATHADTLAAAVVRGSMIVGNSTPKWSALVIGTSGKFIRSDGSDPSWQSILASDVTSGAILSRVDDTNVTLTLGGSPNTALLAASSLTLGWTGTLAIGRGGTGQATAVTAFNALSPLTTRGDLLTRDATDNARVAIGASGKFLRSDATDPSWQSILASDVTAGAALSKVDDTNVTLTLGGTPTTALLAAASLTLGWTGTLGIVRGGTGAATAVAAFDALSPLTTRGDLLTRDASNNVRLTVGLAGKFLRTDGTDASWQRIASRDVTDLEELTLSFRRLLFWCVTTFNELPEGLEQQFEAAASAA